MIRGLREILPDNGKAFSSILISLKTRNFRLYFTGMCVSLTGTWMQQIAMSWLVYRLTGSVFLLATVTFGVLSKQQMVLLNLRSFNPLTH